MLDVLKQTAAAMTAPDQMFAITEAEVCGNMMKTWANAPGSLRDLWLSTTVHGEKDYLVYGDERWTYNQAHEQVARIANWLTFQGIRQNEGKKVEMELNSAKNALRPRPNDTTEEQVKRLQEGLIQMCDANIALRHQLGAITAIVVSGQLFNERTNAQLEKILRKL